MRRISSAYNMQRSEFRKNMKKEKQSISQYQQLNPNSKVKIVSTLQRNSLTSMQDSIFHENDSQNDTYIRTRGYSQVFNQTLGINKRKSVTILNKNEFKNDIYQQLVNDYIKNLLENINQNLNQYSVTEKYIQKRQQYKIKQNMKDNPAPILSKSLNKSKIIKRRKLFTKIYNKNQFEINI